eukprot:5814004-Alexandrium_andersonii.AAC.1
MWRCARFSCFRSHPRPEDSLQARTAWPAASEGSKWGKEELAQVRRLALQMAEIRRAFVQEKQ